jgi:ribosome-associated heat shock protein Hsp15
MQCLRPADVTNSDLTKVRSEPDQATLRIDKWLWFARFVKSRSLASKLVETGRMRVNGTPTVKAHYSLRVGDVLTFALGPHIRVVKVVELGSRRGPAVEAQGLYLDLDPPAARIGKAADAAPIADAGQRAMGSGRPTKRERREIDRLQSDD